MASLITPLLALAAIAAAKSVGPGPALENHVVNTVIVPSPAEQPSPEHFHLLRSRLLRRS